MTGPSGKLSGLPVVMPRQPGPRDVDAADLPADREAGVVAVFEAHYSHLVRLARHLTDDPADYAHLPPGRARREITDAVMDRVAALSGQPRAAGYNEHSSGV